MTTQVLTPPSPDLLVDSADLLLQSLVLPTKVPRWKCRRGLRPGDSVLGQGELERTLNGSRPVPQLKTEPSLEVLGVVCGLRAEDWDTSNLEDVVSALEQELLLLQAGHESGSGAFRGVELGDLEQRGDRVAVCLAFLRELAWYHGNRGEMGWVEKLREEVVRPLLLHMERLEDLPCHVTSHADCSDYFHIWMEVRWTLLSITFHLGGLDLAPLVHLPFSVSGQSTSWLQQLLAATVVDLVNLATKRMSSAELGQRGLVTDWSLFSCPCQEELWLCLELLAQKTQMDILSLVHLCWVELAQEVELEPDLSVLQYNSTKKDKEAFLVFVSSFSRLLKSSAETLSSLGMGEKNEKIFKAMRKFLRTFLQSNPTEQSLRLGLQVVQLVFSLFGPSMDILDELWKSLSQSSHLNSSCRLNTMSLAGSTTLPSTPSSWLAMVQDNTSTTSFLLFVYIVRQALHFWQNNTGPSILAKESRFLISRISVKLTPKKLAELTEYGVYHLGSLLLVLCSTVQTPGPASSLLELVGGRGQGQATRLKLGLALCLLRVEAGHDVVEAGSAVSQLVGEAVVRYSQATTDVASKRAAQDMVKIFMEGLSEVANQSLGLSSGEACFVQPWLSTYLDLCSTHEISTICSSLTDLLTRARVQLSCSEEREGPASLLDQLWTVVYPVLRKLATHLTAPPQVASLAADLIAQQAESGVKSAGRETVLQMIRFFGLSQQVSPAVSTCLVSRLTQNTAVLERLEQEAGSAVVLLEVIAVCCLAPDNKEQQLRLSWRALASRLGMLTGGEKGDLLLDMLDQLVNSEHGASVVKGLAEECIFQAQKWKHDPQHVMRLYQVSGWLVRHCTHLLYQPGGGDTTFTSLVGKLITPHAAFDLSLAVPVHLKKALEKSLPDFLVGFIGAKSFKEDKFLRRSFTEIIWIYIGRFEVPQHPLLPLLTRPGLQVSEGRLEDVQKLSVSTMVRMLKDLRSKNPPVIVILLNFCASCLTRPAGSTVGLLARELLPLLLDLIILTDNKAVKNPAILLLLALVKDNKVEELVKRQLMTFVSRQLAFNSERVFQTLSVIKTENSKMVSSLWTSLENEVEKVEERRGSGQDSRLRKLLSEFRPVLS